MSLYDPGEFPTETKVGADFTLADVLAWARTKDADEGYDYCAANACVVAQFGRETGRLHLIGIGDLRSEHPTLEEAANPSFPYFREWTFGAFADRLEKAIS